MNEIDEIVYSMMDIQDKIEQEEKKLLNLRVIYYKYKEYLMKKYPDENIDVLVYLTKEKIKKNERR